jgi:hypothetical protein
MADCVDESTTQHFRGSWGGFGPVADAETVVLAIFNDSPRDNDRLVQDSFDRKVLNRSEQSLARLAYTSRHVFRRNVEAAAISRSQTVTGVAVALVSALRSVLAEATSGHGHMKSFRALCVTDWVRKEDYEGHSALGFSETTKGPGISQAQRGKIYAKIRLDLAEEFSKIKGVESLAWPNTFNVWRFWARARMLALVRMISN